MIPFDIAVSYGPKLDLIAVLLLSKNRKEIFHEKKPHNTLYQYLVKPV